MRKFSILSIVLMFIGLLLFGLNWIKGSYSELIIRFSFISFLVGIALSFIAVAKREKGILKFISLISFLVVMFLNYIYRI
ncbi:hypothetical protein R3O67_30365 [Bacillus cereus]|uniref:hypothetical protein n=1 Tax=Bacillus cereus TaxID=1396 RepID=UPI0030797C03